MTKPGKAEQSAARHERLSAALRENLKRRKAQARGKAQAGDTQALGSAAGEDLAAREAGIEAEPDFRRNPGSKSGETGRPGAGRRGS
jgi:hypothetical protein